MPRHHSKKKRFPLPLARLERQIHERKPDPGLVPVLSTCALGGRVRVPGGQVGSGRRPKNVSSISLALGPPAADCVQVTSDVLALSAVRGHPRTKRVLVLETMDSQNIPTTCDHLERRKSTPRVVRTIGHGVSIFL